MHQTLENLEELRLGSVLAEDILVNTKNPIIRKDTKDNKRTYSSITRI